VTADLPVDSINALHDAGMSSGASVALAMDSQVNRINIIFWK
jgi:hypothetical protein